MRNLKPYSEFSKTNENIIKKAVNTAAHYVGYKTDIKILSDEMIAKYDAYLQSIYKYYTKRKSIDLLNSTNLEDISKIENRLHLTKNGQEIADCLNDLKDLRHETMGLYHVKMAEFKSLKNKGDFESADMLSDELSSLLQKRNQIDAIFNKFEDVNVNENLNESFLAKSLDMDTVEPFMEWTDDDKLAITKLVKPRKLSDILKRADMVKGNGVEIWMDSKTDLYNKWVLIFDIEELKRKEAQPRLKK